MVKNWTWYTLSVDAPNYVPLAVKKGCEICRFCSRVERVEHSIVFSSESTRRGSKDVLEAVEAGDGMQQPSSIV